MIKILDPLHSLRNISTAHPGDQINITYFRMPGEYSLGELKNVDGTTIVVLESTGEAVFGSKLIPSLHRRRKNMQLIPDKSHQCW